MSLPDSASMACSSLQRSNVTPFAFSSSTCPSGVSMGFNPCASCSPSSRPQAVYVFSVSSMPLFYASRHRPETMRSRKRNIAATGQLPPSPSDLHGRGPSPRRPRCPDARPGTGRRARAAKTFPREYPTPYAPRRTFVMLNLANGENIKTVSVLLGHESTDTHSTRMPTTCSRPASAGHPLYEFP